jgi:microsomal dipeptidase-like Zn-dependent dipeptidase
MRKGRSSLDIETGNAAVCSDGDIGRRKARRKCMEQEYQDITRPREVREEVKKLRKKFLRYQEAEVVYSISHRKLIELADRAGALYRMEGTVLINRDIFDAYLENFHEQTRGIGKRGLSKAERKEEGK